MTYAVALNPHLGMLQAAVTCDLRYDGLVCRNEDLPAGMTCPDFQVRFLCEPRGQDCSGVPTPSTSHPQVGPHSPTHFTGHRTPSSQVQYPGKQSLGSECSVSSRSELRSCVKVEVAVPLGSPSLTSLMVSVDAKQH